jgi:hypothetical protein
MTPDPPTEFAERVVNLKRKSGVLESKLAETAQKWACLFNA